jgi:hypothetical protein
MKSGVSSPASVSDAPKKARGKRDAALDEMKRPGLVDATIYDMDRLERVVVALTRQHRALQQQGDDREKLLEQREARICELEAKVEEFMNRRADALERLDRVIAELGRLEARAGDDSRKN